MVLFMAIFGVLAAAFAAEAARRTRMSFAARAEAADLRSRLNPPPPPPPPPAPVRLFECRREHLGLLWFLVLTVKEEGMQVVGASSGLPHCLRCVAPLKLVWGAREEWVCVGCEDRHPGANADLRATDALLTECLREFFARHPDFSPAPGLTEAKFEPPVRRAPRHAAAPITARRKLRRALI